MSIVRFYWGGALHAPARYALDREQKEFLKNQTFYGRELVPTTFKLCLMNLYLHNIGDIYGNVPVTLGDALLTDPGYRVDYVLTNPPFGKKSSITFTNEEGEQEEEAAGDLRPAYDPAPAHRDFLQAGRQGQRDFL